MPTSRTKLVIAVMAAMLFGVASYLVSTVGVRAVLSSEVSSTTAPGRVPEVIYNAPETVPTTADYGPIGPVSMVFAGTHVLAGLSGELDNPWIAIGSQTGEYRALSAPHRPEPAPDAVALAPDGTALAWAFRDGVVIYDPVEDEAREVAGSIGADPMVGPFSPDGRQLAVFDGSLRVLEVDSGKVVATLSGVGEKVARHVVWTPDGAALNYVAAGRFVTHAWQSDAVTAAPASIPQDAKLAWQPAGEQLAAMRDVRGVKVVEVFDVAADGRLRLVRVVTPDGYALQELIGFTSDTQVAVIALTLETGPIAMVYEMSTVDASLPTQVVHLPGDGQNWAGRETLQVAAQPLSNGNAAFQEPSWPWSDVSKLVASIVGAVFALGLYVTRPPTRR